MGEYYNLNAVETVADPENITGFTISGTSYSNGNFTQDGVSGGKKRWSASSVDIYWNSNIDRWFINDGDTRWFSNDGVDYPWDATWLVGDGGGSITFSNFVSASIVDKFDGDVTRPVGLSPNTGSVTDYFCYYKTWTGQADGGSPNNETVSLGDFGTWTLIKNDAGSDSIDADLIFIRKSDRKAIQVTGDLFTPGSITVTDVTNVNYPELQRLRLLGIV